MKQHRTLTHTNTNSFGFWVTNEIIIRKYLHFFQTWYTATQYTNRRRLFCSDFPTSPTYGYAFLTLWKPPFMTNTTMAKTRATTATNKPSQAHKQQDTKTTPTKTTLTKKNDKKRSNLEEIRKNMGPALEAASSPPTPMETDGNNSSMEIEEPTDPSPPLEKSDYSSTTSQPPTVPPEEKEKTQLPLNPSQQKKSGVTFDPLTAKLPPITEDREQPPPTTLFPSCDKPILEKAKKNWTL